VNSSVVNTIVLHPRIAKLLSDEVKRLESLPKTKRQEALKSLPATADEIANEILWLALRQGDIGKHYTSEN